MSKAGFAGINELGEGGIVEISKNCLVKCIRNLNIVKIAQSASALIKQRISLKVNRFQGTPELRQPDGNKRMADA